MHVMYPFLLVIHVLVSLALVVAVLLQSSKGEGLAGAFGGGGLSGAVFGGRGAATFLSKATTFLAIGFMSTSIILFVSLGIRTTSGPASGVLDDLQGGGVDVAPPPATSVPGEVPASGEQAQENLFEQVPQKSDSAGD